VFRLFGFFVLQKDRPMSKSGGIGRRVVAVCVVLLYFIGSVIAQQPNLDVDGSLDGDGKSVC
jgi:hypothetical protein